MICIFLQLSPITQPINNNQNMQDDYFQDLFIDQPSWVPFNLSTQELACHIDPDSIGGAELSNPLIIDSSPIGSQTNSQGQDNYYNTQTQEGEIPKRVNNTIFKTGASSYRKSILEHINSCPNLDALHQDIEQVCKAKNMSVFPKLNFMVRWLRLDPVDSIWLQRKEEMLAKKKKLMDSGHYKSARMDALKEIVKNMDNCIKVEIFEIAFKSYWGKYRQHSKYDTCWEEVNKFCEQFMRDNPKGELTEKQQMRKTIKKRKNTSN